MKESAKSSEISNTLLGELIATLVQETQRVVPDEKEAYKLVATILSDCLLNLRLNAKSWN